MFAPVAVQNNTFPEQNLKVFGTFEGTQWQKAGEQFNTTYFQYATGSARIGTSYAGSAKWYGSALAGNGKIYSPGHTRTDWLITDTATDTTAITGSVNAANMGAVWDKITNKVYAFGSSGSRIDPTTNIATNLAGPKNRTGGGVQSFDGNKIYTVSLFDAGGLTTGVYEYDINTNTNSLKSAQGDKYTGGTLALNGKIYWGPGGGTVFLQYDPQTNTATTFGSVSGDNFGPIVQHYDGYLYCFPRFFINTILRINPNTNQVVTIKTGVESGNVISTQACIGADGRIYVTRESAGVYWYDPYTNATGTITMASSDTGFAGIEMGPSGDLYVTPYNSTYVHKISLVRGSGYAQKVIQEYNTGGRYTWPS